MCLRAVRTWKLDHKDSVNKGDKIKIETLTNDTTPVIAEHEYDDTDLVIIKQDSDQEYVD